MRGCGWLSLICAGSLLSGCVSPYPPAQRRDYAAPHAHPRSTHHHHGGDLYYVQSRLSTMGYYHGTPDGISGPETSAAISDFQRDHGLPRTGWADGNVMRQLSLE